MLMKKGIATWKNLIRFIWNYFSMVRLLRTLVAPWKADTYSSSSQATIERLLQNVIFSITTRSIGVIIRFTTIVVGVIALVLAVVVFPFFLIIPVTIPYERFARLGSIGKTWSFPATPFLDKHSREMRHAPNRYVPGSRKKILHHLERILVKNTGGHVLLGALEGAGVTVMLQHLAKNIHWGLVDDRLDFKRVVQLIPDDMTDTDITRALDEAEQAKNVILVIERLYRYDHLHALLQQYMDNGTLKCIYTTTPSHYHAEIKNNEGFMRYVEYVDLPALSQVEVMAVVYDYFDVHGVQRPTEKAVLELIELTDTTMGRTPQPKKSIGILDELLSTGNAVTIEHIRQLISEKTHIPMNMLTQDEKEVLLSLESAMQEKIIGQREAISEVTSALKRSRSGIGSADRPIGAFLFLGPTGVGKTYTAQVLAQQYFGRKEAMIRFDMSEYREITTLDQFVTRAATAIEQQPYALVFIDEIEKAHPDILNIFLQIFDEGRLTGPDGITVSFDHAIIICTSNAGSALIQQDGDLEKDVLVEHVINEGIFRPEFMNRFDAVTMFHQLSEEQVFQVAELMLESLNARIQKNRGIRIDITEALVRRIAKEGYDPKFGARPIRRALQEVVENRLADRILRGDIEEGAQVSIDLETE